MKSDRTPGLRANYKLCSAARNGKVDVVIALIADGAAVNMPDEHGRTPLHVALLQRRVKTAKALLDHGADVEARDNSGQTALHLAVRYCSRIDTAIALLERGAEINAKDEHDVTALHVAVFRGHVKLVQALLDRGADVNIAAHRYYTPLRVAVPGPIGIVKALLDKNANINVTGPTGRTVLHRAVSTKNHALVMLLCERGADPALRDYGGNTPADLAVALGDPVLIDVFNKWAPEAVLDAWLRRASVRLT
jgi:ankyrin repeat protein